MAAPTCGRPPMGMHRFCLRSTPCKDGHAQGWPHPRQNINFHARSRLITPSRLIHSHLFPVWCRPTHAHSRWLFLPITAFAHVPFPSMTDFARGRAAAILAQPIPTLPVAPRLFSPVSSHSCILSDGLRKNGFQHQGSSFSPGQTITGKHGGCGVAPVSDCSPGEGQGFNPRSGAWDGRFAPLLLPRWTYYYLCGSGCF